MTMRPEHNKARSIKLCSQPEGLRCISVERKYDSEYCQVYVDLRRGMGRVEIFSRFRKWEGLTNDREGLHRAISETLDDLAR
jgi:DNA ligase 4